MADILALLKRTLVRADRLRRSGTVLFVLVGAACSSGSESDGPIGESAQALGGSYTSRTIQVADPRADFRDIWAVRETPDTGMQATPKIQSFDWTGLPRRGACRRVVTPNLGSASSRYCTYDELAEKLVAEPGSAPDPAGQKVIQTPVGN